MRKFVMAVALAVCMGLLLGGVAELDLIGDVQAQIDTPKKKVPPKKKPPKKRPSRCGTPDALCDPTGRSVRCHGCVYDSLDCALSTTRWDEDQCRPIQARKKKAPPKKKK